MKIRIAFDNKETRPKYLWGWLPSPYHAIPIPVNGIYAVLWCGSDKAIETLNKFINQEPKE